MLPLKTMGDIELGDPISTRITCRSRAIDSAISLDSAAIQGEVIATMGGAGGAIDTGDEGALLETIHAGGGPTLRIFKITDWG